MPDPTPGAGITSKQSLRLRYKIICYAVAWLAALFATNPNGGLWALARMFPLGLAAFIHRRWANSGRRGGFSGWLAAFFFPAVVFFRSRQFRAALFLF